MGRQQRRSGRVERPIDSRNSSTMDQSMRAVVVTGDPGRGYLRLLQSGNRSDLEPHLRLFLNSVACCLSQSFWRLGNAPQGVRVPCVTCRYRRRVTGGLRGVPSGCMVSMSAGPTPPKRLKIMTATASKPVLQISAPDFRTIAFDIQGTAPLVINKFSAKARNYACYARGRVYS